MLNSARWGLPIPEGTDAPNVPAWASAQAAILDAVAMDDQGLLSARPTSTVGSPGKRGRYYYATDEGVLYRDHGTGWAAIGATPGDMKATARSTAPSGWLLCDGAAVSRTTYAALFDAIGTSYGVGDGSTTFGLPDLRGRVPVGVDGTAARLSANDALGQASGAEKHTLTGGELPPHSHSLGYTLPGSTGPWQTKIDTAGGGAAASIGSTALFTSNPYSVNFTQLDGGGNQPHNNMPPYQVVNWLIKT